MRIQIKNLSLNNFKGIRSLQINFEDAVTDVLGRNASGKTTIMDAFLWLLFGKDSAGRKDFEIKTLENGVVLHQLDHEVAAILVVDGTEIGIRRVYREKWQKKRGALQSELTGHETLYYWNDVPLQQQEYQAKINGLVDEELFKLLTNPLYFSSLRWQDRRRILMQLVGDISDSSIAGDNEEFQRLLAEISGKSLLEYKREIASRKKKINDDLKLIPARIDEAMRSMPEPIDFELVEANIKMLQESIADTENRMLNESENQKFINDTKLQKQQEIYQLTRKINDIKNSIRESFETGLKEDGNKISELHRTIRFKQDELGQILSEILRREKLIEAAKKERVVLREEWEAINKEELVFNPNEFCCPTCNRAYDAADVEAKQDELRKNFNETKQHKLQKVTDRGTQLTKEIEDAQEALEKFAAGRMMISKEVERMKIELEERENAHRQRTAQAQQEIERQIASNTEILDAQNRIEMLEREVEAGPVATNSETAKLREEKANLTAALDAEKRKLALRDQGERVKERIASLQLEEQNLAQQLADLEKSEFTIDQFNKAKMDTLERRINSTFRHVKFRLFEQQINGGEAECCEILVQGVPFSDANNAAKINAGLDIINTLSRHYNVSAPIFIDNRESVIELIPSECQIVNLIVSDCDLKVVRAKEPQLAMA